MSTVLGVGELPFGVAVEANFVAEIGKPDLQRLTLTANISDA